MTRRLPVFAAAFALVFGLSAAASASTVDSSNFSPTSSSSTLDNSCKMLDISGTTLSGECNKVANGRVSSGHATSLNLDSYATCNESNELAWGSGGLSAVTGLDVDLSSTGSKYLLEGTCSGGAESELDLRERISNDTANGAFKYAVSAGIQGGGDDCC